MSPKDIDEENQLSFIRREMSKDDSFLVGKYSKEVDIDHELINIEHEIAHHIDH